MRLSAHADLSARNTLRLPATARQLWQIDALEELTELPHVVPNLVLGGGSNLVLASDLDLVVQICAHAVDQLEADSEHVIWRVEAGLDWVALVERAVDAGLWGIENLALIPGTVGAAPIQNIGAYGAELSDVLRAVEVYDPQRRKHDRWPSAQLALGYRDSIFKKLPASPIIVAVELELSRAGAPRLSYPGLADELPAQPRLRQIHDQVCAIRRRKLPDPQTQPNVGSFFKNPRVSAETAARLRAEHPRAPAYEQPDGSVKLSAGWLIEVAGLKGHRQGAFAVSPQHALVLVHEGGGSGAELLAFAEQLIRRVETATGIRLEIEPTVIR